MKKEALIREYLQKLRSKKGSALLLSLLFSTVSIIIATVILNAATSSGRRVEETAESSQAYYLVSSLFSVFEYEATSPKRSDTQDPDKGMVFTADIAYDSSQSIEANVIINVPLEAPDTDLSLPKELYDKTNLNALRNHIAYCLTKAMLSGETAARTFKVSVGGASAATGISGYDCDVYELSGMLSVNPVDYSVRITVTEITDLTDPTKKTGLPEIRTLVLPTEKVNVLRVEEVTVSNTVKRSRPTKAEFIYQKAKYLPES